MQKLAKAEKPAAPASKSLAAAPAAKPMAVAAAKPAPAPAPVKPEKVAVAKVEPPKPMKVAKVEVPEVKKPVPVDPTPTASLPPAAAPVASASANPEFRWPARGRIIQGFKSGGNDGINIAVPEGTAVKAAESGVVAYAGSEIKGFGNLVLIRHPNGYVSAYANNGELGREAGRAGEGRSDHRQIRSERQRRLAAAALRAAQGIDAGRPDAVPRRSLRFRNPPPSPARHVRRRSVKAAGLSRRLLTFERPQRPAV